MQVFMNAINELPHKADLEVIGQVRSMRRHWLRKQQEPFISGRLGLLDGVLEFVLAPRVFARDHELMQEGAYIHLTGDIRNRNDKRSMCVFEVQPYDITGKQIEGSTGF